MSSVFELYKQVGQILMMLNGEAGMFLGVGWATTILHNNQL